MLNTYESTEYLYDLWGQAVSAVQSATSPPVWTRGEVYAAGRHVATYVGGTTYFTHSDWLGNERIRTNVDGSVSSGWANLPFGEGSSSPNPGPTHFTGKERDSETGLDYFGARYYGSTMGRWLSPDWATSPEAVPYADLTDPQTLNLYGYVRNNPLSHTDADGHCCDVQDVVETIGGIASALDDANGISHPSVLQNEFGRAIGNTLAATQGLLEIVGGASATATGAAEAVATAPAATTVVGALVPAAGAAAATAGIVVSAHGSVVLGTAINQMSSLGPKAKDAPGVSSSGQATDEYGNKLGGSGKPQQHETTSNTREGAHNKALNEGSTAVNHSNPKQGDPHYHAGDAQGNKKPNSTHHKYPDN